MKCFAHLHSLANLLDCKLSGQANPLQANPLIEGMSIDSRTTNPGDLFFALPGTNLQGHQFISQAIQKGAGAVVCQEALSLTSPDVPVMFVKDVRQALGKMASHFYGNPTSNLQVVGITGTNGKTTTSHLLKSILDQAGLPAGLIGTIHYQIGDTTYPANNTTPSSLAIHQMAAQALREGLKAMVMEVSSHGLAQQRLAGVALDRAIFTNLSGDHLDYHGSMEEYSQAKAQLFSMLPHDGWGLFNGDDPASSTMKNSSTGRSMSYSIQDPSSDFRAREIQLGLYQTSFVIQGPSFSIPITTGLIGMHNILNCLAAVSCASSMGIHPGFIQKGLQSLSGVAGRLESIANPCGFQVLVDYAHTDDALKNVLTLISGLKRNRIITVFGCGGNRDATKRPRMGNVATQLSDWVIITSDNPRKEDPQAIIQDIQQGVTSSNYQILVQRRQAIFQALSMAQEGDIVLIAGKGHEDYQEGKNGRIAFDDRVVAREALKILSKKVG